MLFTNRSSIICTHCSYSHFQIRFPRRAYPLPTFIFEKKSESVLSTHKNPFFVHTFKYDFSAMLSPSFISVIPELLRRTKVILILCRYVVLSNHMNIKRVIYTTGSFCHTRDALGFKTAARTF